MDVQMLTCRFDYLRGTLEIEQLCHLQRLLTDLDPAWGYTERLFWSGKSYQRGFKSVHGMVGGHSLTPSGNYEVLIDLPGRYCAGVDQYEIVTRLKEAGLKFTRVDIALDDYHRRVSFDEVARAGRQGDFALVDSFKFIESGVRGGVSVPTCYFGQSDKVLRFYNAEFIHEIKADRWELQLRGDYPNLVISEYLEDPNCLPFVLIGAVDFLDRSAPHRHLKRLSRLSWWQSIALEVGASVKLPSRQIERSPEKIQQWLQEQVAPSLAVLRYGWGKELFYKYLENLCVDSTSRLTGYHNAMIQSLRGEICK